MVKQKDTIKKIKDILIKNPDGITLDFKGNILNKSDGFYISITNIKGKNLNLLLRRLFFIKRFAFNQMKNKLILGFWKDKDNKNYLDLSLYTPEKEKAKYLGVLFNQIAIFNIKELNCIYLKNDN
jgi:hypothetical protein